ncbi:MAG TPA: DUF3099 domain-containing protein [Cryptosporangiaceae bacterium]|nr:DUF3099 domain-containing protein [Cryptosporangiaceae bacterium]
MRARRPQVPVITGAEKSPQAQLRERQIRYAALMGLRVVCLVIAAVLVSLRVPYVFWWILLLTGGMVLFPWMAVLIANDRPPKRGSRFSSRLHRAQPADPPAAGPALPAPGGGDAPGPAADTRPALPSTRVIEH